MRFRLGFILCVVFLTMPVTASKAADLSGPEAPSSPTLRLKRQGTGSDARKRISLPPSQAAAPAEQGASCDPLVFTSPTRLPPGAPGRYYAYSLRVSGAYDPVSFELKRGGALPAGLQLQPDGRISGTPLQPGRHAFTVTVRDTCPIGSRNVRKQFHMTILPAAGTLRTLSEPMDARHPPSAGPLNRAPSAAPRVPRAEESPSGQGALPRAAGPCERAHVPGHILVVLERTAAPSRVHALQDTYGLNVVERFRIRALGLHCVLFRADGNPFEVVERLKGESGVMDAQPNHIFETASEPMEDLQQMARVLNFDRLHRHRTGRNVTIAILDTGIDTSHRDLSERIRMTGNLMSESLYRAEIHGTAVAGLIGASVNHFGIQGIAPDVDILALRACEQISEGRPEGRGNTISVVKALDMALEQGARVVNMSIGTEGPDNLILRLLKEGAGRGVLFTAPVGNRSGKHTLLFPASSAYVIGVGGTDEQGRPWPDPQATANAHVLAPATNLLTTIPGNRHNVLSGASLASAVVAGVLVLAVETQPETPVPRMPAGSSAFCPWAEKVMGLSFCVE